jgi:hypothetical protein
MKSNSNPLKSTGEAPPQTSSAGLLAVSGLPAAEPESRHHSGEVWYDLEESIDKLWYEMLLTTE